MNARNDGRALQSVGFVPTMGCLHEGHLSLVRLAKKENDVVVVSIFVNPLQFGPGEDYKRYPRSMERDRSFLKKAGVNFLLAPSEKNFYAKDFQTSVTVKELATGLCGRSRPTHFGGVATVVLKLLNIVGPDRIYLGQKDYQQFRVVEQMVKDLDVPVQVRMAPIVREKDGLAMSSRNVFLSAQERKDAPLVYRSLLEGKNLVKSGVRDVKRLQKAMRDVLKAAPHARVEYLEIVDAVNLRPMVKFPKAKPVLMAAAVFFGKTRLIDNILIRTKA
ncbi:MAG: pantoate--beta-alanine ligase [Candidatus Omnitrophica bacterium]|nr:pantoate--beta-alanine ligase [Candidatus Omnitrophota bacterium]